MPNIEKALAGTPCELIVSRFQGSEPIDAPVIMAIMAMASPMMAMVVE
jgi:hypothetical protein